MNERMKIMYMYAHASALFVNFRVGFNRRKADDAKQFKS